MNGSNATELLFTQSLDGIFFMMLDEPMRWDDSIDKACSDAMGFPSR